MSTELINSRKDFSGGEIEIIAENKNLEEVLSFVNSQLENSDCSFKELTQINLAVEEIGHVAVVEDDLRGVPLPGRF